MPMEITPQLIRAARILMGHSQAELASISGMSARTVLMVEQGTASDAMRHQMIGFMTCEGITFSESESHGRKQTGITYRPRTPPGLAAMGETALECLRWHKECSDERARQAAARAPS
jgi:transcriptional regulator with XRE-family HTH domain